MTIKAIETQYKGYRFRSRLEARWAVFFDELGIAWQYEPEGYEKTGLVFVGAAGEEGDESKYQERVVARYLPDFYLPETGTWIEVKGNMTLPEARKLADFLDYGCPLPLFHSSHEAPDWKACRDRGVVFSKAVTGLILLGDIPEPRHGTVLHPIVTHSRGLWFKWAKFTSAGPVKVPTEWINGAHSALNFDASRMKSRPAGIDGSCADDDELVSAFCPKAEFIATALAHRATVRAYEAARSARFEHGQSGAYV